MSRWARWTIGIAALLGGASLLLLPPRPTDPWAVAIIIVTFGLIVIACFSELGRPVAVRIIGGAVASVYFLYVLIALDPNYARKLRADFNVKPWAVFLGAVIGFLFWGLPGLYVLITGKFPWWLRKIPNREPKDKEDKS
jgi:hypothetical protein